MKSKFVALAALLSLCIAILFALPMVIASNHGSTIGNIIRGTATQDYASIVPLGDPVGGGIPNVVVQPLGDPVGGGIPQVQPSDSGIL